MKDLNLIRFIVPDRPERFSLHKHNLRDKGKRGARYRPVSGVARYRSVFVSGQFVGAIAGYRVDVQIFVTFDLWPEARGRCMRPHAVVGCNLKLPRTYLQRFAPAREAGESCSKLIAQVDSAFELNFYRYR